MNWIDKIEVKEKIVWLTFKDGDKKIVTFLNDDPTEHIDKSYGTPKITFLVEHEGRKYYLEFNKNVVTNMQQLVALYPIAGKKCLVTRVGERTNTRYIISQVE